MRRLQEVVALHFINPPPLEGMPSSMQRKEHPYDGILNVSGLPRILVENKHGSVRRGKSGDGTEWSTVMHMHYGEFEGTLGADGDPVDVFVGTDPEGSDSVYVVHQQNPRTREYDECKVLLGFYSKASALAAYRAHYDRSGFVGAVSRLTKQELAEWLADPSKRGKQIRGTPMRKAWEPFSTIYHHVQ